MIGSNGKLTGFGGGLPTKEALLALERRIHPAMGASPEESAVTIFSFSRSAASIADSRARR